MSTIIHSFHKFFIHILQSNEEGVRKCLQMVNMMLTKDSSKLRKLKVANVQYNLKGVREYRMYPWI